MQWHQLGHNMQSKQSAPRSRQTPTPHHLFLQTGCSSWRPTNSVKALKASQWNGKYKMRPIATDIPWSVCPWVTTVGCAKTAQPIEMPFGGCSPRKGLFYWVALASPIVKCREHPACGRYFQPYSIGIGSHAAVRCQYCSNLLLLLSSLSLLFKST